MRMLKQSLLSMVLVLVALFGLNVIRVGRAPAQAGPQGEGAVPVRNGDVDCDGQINITDPIVTLNWLFGDGPEPCAIAQTDTCCADLRSEVALLRTTVEGLVSRLPRPDDILTVRSTVPFTEGAQPMLHVPQGKRLVITSFKRDLQGSEGQLVSILNGNAAPVPAGLGDDAGQTWSSGVALPPGSDPGLVFSGTQNSRPVGFYLNGYFVDE